MRRKKHLLRVLRSTFLCLHDLMAPYTPVYFDKEHRPHVLDLELEQHTRNAADLTRTFVEKVDHLQHQLGMLHTTLQQQADKVEQEKMKALRARNALATLGQERAQQQEITATALREKQQHLEQLLAQEQLLLRMKHEQDMLLAKLTDATV